jgi:gliding motility-associated lipoprotein GldD
MKHIIPVLAVFSVLLFSCEEYVPTPKPKGYFRIELPQKQYVKIDRTCAYNFEMPTYGRIDTTPSTKEPCWINIHYPRFDATLFLSYKKINNNLPTYLEDARSLTYKHISKANDIDEILIKRDSSKVFGLLYDVKGNAASSLQFYITDSTKHFLRGALYFNTVPNVDSVAPVLSFLRSDVEYFLQTIEWK